MCKGISVDHIPICWPGLLCENWENWPFRDKISGHWSANPLPTTKKYQHCYDKTFSTMLKNLNNYSYQNANKCVTHGWKNHNIKTWSNNLTCSTGRSSNLKFIYVTRFTQNYCGKKIQPLFLRIKATFFYFWNRWPKAFFTKSICK